MDEGEIIAYIRELTQTARSDVVEIGPGDDGASVCLPGGTGVVLSTDMLIEGTHFTSDTPPGKVGGKAIRRALSDLAAMAARPICSLASISFPPERPDAYICALFRGLHKTGESLGAPLAGGDTGSGTDKLVISMTVLGVPGPGGLLRRCGALPGDSICVTGDLGGSIAGRHLSPKPRISEALELAEKFDVHAMIDISDGLSTDLLHIAEESGVGVVLNADAVPIHQDAADMARCEGSGEKGAFSRALGDGEDYELLLCLPDLEAAKLASTGIGDAKISIIGTVSEEMGKKLIYTNGTKSDLRDTGWHHLKNK